MTSHVFQLFTQDLKENFWVERVKNDLEPLHDLILFLLVQVGIVLRHVLIWGFQLCTQHLSQTLIPILWSSSIFVYVRHRHDRVISRGLQIFQQSKSNLNFLSARRMIWSIGHIDASHSEMNYKPRCYLLCFVVCVGTDTHLYM